MSKLRIAVIDGKGGGLGRAVVEAVLTLPGERFALYALGTNAQAPRVMMAAGAPDGATGEHAVCYMAGRMDIIIGPMALLIGNAMMGEITPAMAAAISASPAQKLLLPLARCGVRVVGMDDAPLRELISRLPQELAAMMDRMEAGEAESL